jgi:hypothetical protein
VEGRVIHEPLHDRDEARIQGRDFVFLEHPERDARVEVPHREIGAADVEDREHRQHGGDVEHRQRRPHAVALREPVAMPPERDAVADHRLVRDQATLRIGRGARRVEHQPDVAHPHAQARTMHVHLVARPGGGVEVGLGQVTLCPGPAQQHDVAQLGRTRHLERARVAAALELLEGAVQALDEIDGIGDRVRRDDGDQVAVLDDVGKFARLVARVDRHDHAAAERDREERLDEFRAGVHQHADVVAWPYAERLQRARAAQRAIGQLPVGERAIGEHERQRVRVPIGRREQQVADGRDADARAGEVLRRQQRNAARLAAGRARSLRLSLRLHCRFCGCGPTAGWLA